MSFQAILGFMTDKTLVLFWDWALWGSKMGFSYTWYLLSQWRYVLALYTPSSNVVISLISGVIDCNDLCQN